MDSKFIAHISKNDDGTWASPHLLMDHLHRTAILAEKNANKFQSGPWGKLTGLAHDVGKGRLAWQGYLRSKSGYYDEKVQIKHKHKKELHAIYGAKLVEKFFGKTTGRLLAYSIAGHHAGLPDWSNAEGAGQSSLQFQNSKIIDLEDIDPQFKEIVRTVKIDHLPWKFTSGLDLSLWIRMLFSCLVDADFLDTERYMDYRQSRNRGNYSPMSELLNKLNRYDAGLNKSSSDTPVNQIRRSVRTKCVEKAYEPQGVFSLSVPTGGGKTLSSLAFGLTHAVCHNLDRIIYVMPYTSIIEQNADVFRSAVGKSQVIEHHSNLGKADTDEYYLSLKQDIADEKARLATENWDAPIIVTTVVQFFESLFAAKYSRCRKLHNIAKSVVILDEAQLIPVEFLKPILETMQLLVDHYHVSFVISTATQPAFKGRVIDGNGFIGFDKITEIMGDDVDTLYNSLKRVDIHLPKDNQSITTWENLAEELTQYEQVLCIVSDRKSCRELYNLMPKGTFHLSALMCGQHRSKIIEEIKQKLNEKKPVRVISTQLVEAGVDFDFPVVYRAFAGLDSIAQAAGRCNREGVHPGYGKVVIFNAPLEPPPGILRKAADAARHILSGHYHDPLNHNLFEKFFAELYWKANSLDLKGINALLSPEKTECGIYFRTAAKRFKIVDDSMQTTVLVPYGKGKDLIVLLKTKGPDRRLLRALQRYTVNIYTNDFNQMCIRGAIEEVQPNIYAIVTDSDYSLDIGVLINAGDYNF